MARTVCIDDTSASRTILSRFLREAGHEVVEGATAAEARRLVREIQPDLLFLDVDLPDGNGREVCAEIRRDPTVAHTPIILTSAAASEEADRLDHGADAYLIEPVERDELHAIIGSLLRMSRAEREVRALNDQLNARIKELEALIDTVPVGIAITQDPAFREARINPPLAAILGIPPSEIGSVLAPVGTEAAYRIERDGVPVDPEEMPMTQAGRRGELVRGIEFDVVRSDGTRAHVLAHATAMRNPSGEVTGAVGAFVDITAARREQELQQMLGDAALLLSDSLAVETTLDGVAEVAIRKLADWCVVDLLREGERLERVRVTHRDPSREAAARSLRDLYPPDPVRSHPVFAAFRSRRPQRVTAAQLEREADPRALELARELGLGSLMAIPLLARGKCLGVLTFVSASRAYDERDLAAANQLGLRAALAIDNAMLFHDAYEANRAKDDFLATVSHELRTPLTSIAGWVSLLRLNPGDPEIIGQSVRELENSSNALRRLVEDLLDVARVGSGKLRIESQPTDLSAVVKGACDAAMPAAAAKSIRMDLTCEPQVMILGDPVRLLQVAANLLNNAIKFTPPGGHIAIRLDADRAEATLRVTDTGQGIVPDFLPHVFDRFSQGERAAHTGGLGIGLALVRDLTEMHGGRVHAESEGAGRGATFTIVLPRLKG